MEHKHEEAIVEFNRALEKDPKNVEFLQNRAQCFFDMKQFEDSIKDLEIALSVNDCDPKVLYKLGLTYYAYGKYKKCIK